MASYIVTAKCQDLAERGYALRYEGETITLPDDAPVPKWFKRIDGPAAGEGEAIEKPSAPEAPKTPDVVAEVLLGTSIPGTPTLVNTKNPLGEAKRSPGRPRKTPVGV